MPLIPLSPQAQIAQQVSSKRRILDASQAELAATIGTSQGAIARLEAGTGNPTVDFVERIATALELTITVRIHPKH